MFQWFRNLFRSKAPVKELPPRRELVQWLPGCNLWVPMSANYWQDRGYPRNVAWMLYKEGLEMANELIATGSPRDGNGMYGPIGSKTIIEEKDRGATKSRTSTEVGTNHESSNADDAFLLAQSLSAGAALCSDYESGTGGHADTDGFTGHGGSFGGGGASGGWDGGSSPEPMVGSGSSAPDPSPSFDAGSSISDTSSSVDTSGNC